MAPSVHPTTEEADLEPSESNVSEISSGFQRSESTISIAADAEPKEFPPLCEKCRTFVSYCKSCRKKIGLSSDRNNSLIATSHEFAEQYRSKTKQKPTIPKPFSLYAEDEKRREAKLLKISRLKEELRKKEEKELEVKIQARPVPKHILMPQYDRLMKEHLQKKENKSKERKARGEENKDSKLSYSMKRFLRSKSVNDIQSDLKEKQNFVFKAKPLPKGILDENYSKQLQEKEKIRKARMANRSEELLKSSSVPFTPKKIQRSYSSLCIQISNVKNSVPKADLNAITNRLYVLKDVSNDPLKCKKCEKNFHVEKPKKVSKRNRINSEALFHNIPVRMSNAAVMREKLIREELKNLQRREENTIQNHGESSRKEFHEEIVPRLKSAELYIDPKKEICKRVKNFRESQRSRATEYEKELEEMMRRVSKQLLLIERQSKAQKEVLKQKTFPSCERDDASEQSGSEPFSRGSSSHSSERCKSGGRNTDDETENS